MAISYFPGMPDAGSAAFYTRGFKTADTNAPEAIANGIKGLVWSPCIWLQGNRSEHNFEYADWCVLDFDNGELTLNEAVNNFCDMIHVIGTTKSHQKPKKGGPPTDRFRVMLKFDERVDNLRLYRWNMWKLTTVYPADPACKDGARFFYPCTEIVSASADGYTQEINTDLPDTFDRPPVRAVPVDGKGIPVWIKRVLSVVIPIGERNAEIYKMACDLTRCGFESGAVLDLVLRSATYRGTLPSPGLLREMQQTIASARRKVEREGTPTPKRSE